MADENATLRSADEPAAAWPECRLCSKPFRPGTGRGPGSTACSRNKCREQLYGPSDKDARIKELEARLAEKDAFINTQAALIELLQKQSCTTAAPAPQPLAAPPALPNVQQPAVVQQPAAHAAAAAKSVERQPSPSTEACEAAGDKRSQPSAALAQSSKPPPAKRKALGDATQRANGAAVTTAVWAESEGLLPPGWSERYSASQKCQVYEYRIPLDGTIVTLHEKPRLTTNGSMGGAWHVHTALVRVLYKARMQKERYAPTADAAQQDYEKRSCPYRKAALLLRTRI